ncbi:hypothetical protein [uncultured Chryseobacterium sp.]|uniref:tetratricopeptide repeat protein n=1 Tax=uncultured Chryseobacterium sp. TaxID=259322 RepID=UPI0025D32C6B|nr:hypothetical protein [uncultured Chryseobacterium sp.]
MKKSLNQEAWNALMDNNYPLAAKYWVDGYGLPDDDEELERIFQHVNTLNTAQHHPDLCAILGLIALDYNDIFDEDRESALIQCLRWSHQGLEIDPLHYQCSRNAGSALYWLGSGPEALLYYEKAHSIQPSPVLQIRMFNIRNQDQQDPDFSGLILSDGTGSGMEAYNAGVELNRILIQHPDMPETEQQRITALKKQLYEKAYQLYKDAVVHRTGDYLNDDPHTFAMCCNNLAGELSHEGRYQEAIAIGTEGIEQSPFPVILMNRMSNHMYAGMPGQAITDGKRLLDEYADQLDIISFLSVIDTVCISYLELENYEETLQWADRGLEAYYQINPSDPILQDAEMTRCITNFFINRAKAVAALGIDTDPAKNAREADQLLETMPDNPSLMISRADTFVKEGQWEKALECYEQAIHFGIEKGMERSVQVALYNKGYIQEVYLKESDEALDSFGQSIEAGNNDFWCYYWAVHCAYNLREDEATVQYGESALAALPQQDGVTDDIVAEMYEHIGTAQIDLGNYEQAIKNLEKSLNLNFSQTAQDNLKIAREQTGKQGGFFKKLFGK